MRQQVAARSLAAPKFVLPSAITSPLSLMVSCEPPPPPSVRPIHLCHRHSPPLSFSLSILTNTTPETRVEVDVRKEMDFPKHKSICYAMSVKVNMGKQEPTITSLQNSEVTGLNLYYPSWKLLVQM